MILILPLIAGIVIGLRFKVLALIPATIVTAAFALIVTSWWLVIASGILVQVGYLIGITLRPILSAVWTRYGYLESQQ